jgi:hypothetical protein
MDNDRMTETEVIALLAKVDKEWPIRCQLATLAGFKANQKNPRSLMNTEFDLNLRDLYLEVLFRKPGNAMDAPLILQNFYK